MTFTVKIALQPFEVAFEAGSIAEAVAILTEPDNELSKLAALANGTATDDGSDDGSEEQGTPVATTAAPAAPVKKERKKRNSVEAVAPPPMPVPDAAPPPVPAPVASPVNTAPNANGIPAFLDRTASPAPAVTTMAPPPPVAPAPAPKPPVGTLAPKIVAELRTRATGSPDSGAGLVAWLAGAALVVPNATFDEAMECLQFLDDTKLGPVATALGIS